MLSIDSVAAYNSRFHEIRYSTDTLTGMAENWAEFYRAVSSDRTKDSEGRFYIFALMTQEYKKARWYFRRAIELAYPELDPEHLYGMWLTVDGLSVAECVARIIKQRGTSYYTAWDRF